MVVDELVAMTGACAPKVTALTRRGGNAGTYYPKVQTIVVRRSLRYIGFEGVVIHEFQHHLDALHGITVPNPDHGTPFCRRVADLFDALQMARSAATVAAQ